MTDYSDEELGRFETLVAIVKRLRSPGGCPWDRKQTARSLRPFVIEEAYEVVEAIDSGRPDKLREELGDLLLQVILQAQVGAEEGLFDVGEVVRAINTKLIRRHRWVFGDDEAASPDDAIRGWNRIKVEERGGAASGASILDGIAKGRPALCRAQALTSRAAQVGFDWTKAADVLAKLKEEMGEFEESLGAGSPEELELELGDLLFVLVNVARRLGLDAESALERANTKFDRRFRHIERRLAEKGSGPEQATLEEMDELWDEAKAAEKGAGQ